MNDVLSEGRLAVDAAGNEVYWKSWGSGTSTLLALHGGPGMPSRYLDSFSRLAGESRRVVTYDQLGAGISDAPDTPDKWTVESCVEQVEALRKGLSLGRLDLYGHSWGGWLAQSYVLAYPENVRTLILSGTSASIGEYLANIQDIRVGLGVEKYRILAKFEALQKYDDPEYLRVIGELYAKHVRRAFPFNLETSIQEFAQYVEAGYLDPGPAYERMWGPNEFCCTGPLVDWDVTADLPKIAAPTLILCGLYDEVTVSCSQTLSRGIPDNEFLVFGNGSHMSMWERESELFFAAIENFISRRAQG